MKRLQSILILFFTLLFIIEGMVKITSAEILEIPIKEKVNGEFPPYSFTKTPVYESITQSFCITNDKAERMRIIAVSLLDFDQENKNTPHFSIVFNTVQMSIAKNNSFIVEVAYHPQEVGTHQISLIIPTQFLDNKNIQTEAILYRVELSGNSDSPRDSDGDGMHDYWEKINNTDPNDKNDKLLDNDGDGFNNIQEFIMETNPNIKEIPVEYTVNSGQGIQEVINSAHPYDIIKVKPGTYNGTITLGLCQKIIGEGPGPVILNTDGHHTAISLEKKYSKVEISNLQIFDFKTNGIFVGPTNEVTIKNILIVDDSGGRCILNEGRINSVNNTIIQRGEKGLALENKGIVNIENTILYTENGYCTGITSNGDITLRFSNYYNPNCPISDEELNKSYNDKDMTNMSHDPKFISGTWHINRHISPCIDMGNPDPEYYDTNDSRNDMGMDGGGLPESAIDNVIPQISFSYYNTGNGKKIINLEDYIDDKNIKDNYKGSGLDQFIWDYNSTDGLQKNYTGTSFEHRYDQDGVYIITLLVSDHRGNINSKEFRVFIGDNATDINNKTSIIGDIRPYKISETVKFVVDSSSKLSSNYTWRWKIYKEYEEQPLLLDEESSSISGGELSFTLDDKIKPGGYKIILENEAGTYSHEPVRITVVEKNREIKWNERIKRLDNPNKIKYIKTKVDNTEVSILVFLASLNTEEAEITISAVRDCPPLPEGVTGIGTPVDFGPDGLNFSTSVTINFNYAEADLTDIGTIGEGAVDLYRYDNTSTWQKIKNITRDNNEIEIETTHFCIYRLGIDSSSIILPPKSSTLPDLKITPPEETPDSKEDIPPAPEGTTPPEDSPGSSGSDGSGGCFISVIE
ncbi:MAG: hypothetical protein V1872_02910 [bacterium]